MKYVQLTKNQVKGLYDLSNSQFNYLQLQTARLDNGDELCLIGQKIEDNKIRIVWVSKKDYDSKPYNEIMPYIY